MHHLRFSLFGHATKGERTGDGRSGVGPPTHPATQTQTGLGAAARAAEDAGLESEDGDLFAPLLVAPQRPKACVVRSSAGVVGAPGFRDNNNPAAFAADKSSQHQLQHQHLLPQQHHLLLPQQQHQHNQLRRHSDSSAQQVRLQQRDTRHEPRRTSLPQPTQTGHRLYAPPATSPQTLMHELIDYACNTLPILFESASDAPHFSPFSHPPASANHSEFDCLRFFLDPLYKYQPNTDPEHHSTTTVPFSKSVYSLPDQHPATPAAPPPHTIPPLKQFITKLLKRTQLSHSTFLHSLYLLHRLHTLHPTTLCLPPSRPSTRNTPLITHRLVLGALIVSAKVLYDDTYDNHAWKAVAQGVCVTVADVNCLERAVLGLLGFDVGAGVGREEWRAFCREVGEGICGGGTRDRGGVGSTQSVHPPQAVGIPVAKGVVYSSGVGDVGMGSSGGRSMGVSASGASAGMSASSGMSAFSGTSAGSGSGGGMSILKKISNWTTGSSNNSFTGSIKSSSSSEPPPPLPPPRPSTLLPIPPPRMSTGYFSSRPPTVTTPPRITTTFTAPSVRYPTTPSPYSQDTTTPQHYHTPPLQHPHHQPHTSYLLPQPPSPPPFPPPPPQRDLVREIIYADTESLVTSADYKSVITKNRPPLVYCVTAVTAAPTSTDATLAHWHPGYAAARFGDGNGTNNNAMRESGEDAAVFSGREKESEVFAVAESAIAAEQCVDPTCEEVVRMRVFETFRDASVSSAGSEDVGGAFRSGKGDSAVDSAVELLSGLEFGESSCGQYFGGAWAAEEKSMGDSFSRMKVAGFDDPEFAGFESLDFGQHPPTRGGGGFEEDLGSRHPTLLSESVGSMEFREGNGGDSGLLGEGNVWDVGQKVEVEHLWPL
ncbi:hypothetical protein HDU98_004181 [Podochytrium sp. JEL0797]|nr:hypothetical protein HDU98_004181 [Podochytrium sp. JEL0797]